nr:unnamed protein product [Callosobruchus analis]
MKDLMARTRRTWLCAITGAVCTYHQEFSRVPARLTSLGSRLMIKGAK